MNTKVTGCKDCPFYVDERDLDRCHHPIIADSIEAPRYGKDVYEAVFKLKKNTPDWCPLKNEEITIELISK